MLSAKVFVFVLYKGMDSSKIRPFAKGSDHGQTLVFSERRRADGFVSDDASSSQRQNGLVLKENQFV